MVQNLVVMMFGNLQQILLMMKLLRCHDWNWVWMEKALILLIYHDVLIVLTNCRVLLLRSTALLSKNTGDLRGWLRLGWGTRSHKDIVALWWNALLLRVGCWLIYSSKSGSSSITGCYSALLYWADYCSSRVGWGRGAENLNERSRSSHFLLRRGR